MAELSQESLIIQITSPINDAEPASYTEVLAVTLRRSNWLVVHLGNINNQTGTPLARVDLAVGLENFEVDKIPDLGAAYSGGTGSAGMGHITTSFPFVFEAGVRISARVRNAEGIVKTFDLQIRLIRLIG